MQGLKRHAPILGSNWMKSAAPRDRVASVRARLLNLARERGEDFQITLRNYLFERFLYRATADLDLLARGSNDPKSVGRDIARVCAISAPEEAASFDPASIAVGSIRAEEEYAGVRVTLEARLGIIRERLQVDVGFGDALWPQAEELVYPVALGEAAPVLRAYRPETVIAEKLEAIVSLGIRNSRIKDFFDIDFLARTEQFDRETLVEAIRRTFAQRSTPIPTDAPIGLTPEFWNQPGRDAHVRAFSRRARLTATAVEAADLGLRVAAFAIPLLRAASEAPANNHRRV
jgi:hypothetical protein